MRRLLLVGGVAAESRPDRRAAAEAARRRSVVVLPESPYFEALGTALLTREEPAFTTPAAQGKPARWAPFRRCACMERVQAIARPAGRRRAGRRRWHAPLVLGVDAGSTTTKAVLIDPGTRAWWPRTIVRTNGDPVEATRQCLRALVEQVGTARSAWSATTGSGRELIGAYLNTPHVYNEISAHAAGAAEFDPDVDTIFEIGGQDSKYIFLRNGVPIDYAMNAACSAGTGFVSGRMCRRAIWACRWPRSPRPPCAPMRRSSSRPPAPPSSTPISAPRSRRASPDEDVAAGLVYAIVRNYLAKVKERRAVGQEGVFPRRSGPEPGRRLCLRTMPRQEP